MNIPQHNSPDSCFESLWLKCINRIGRGSTRDVYEIPDSNKVLKVSNRQSNFTNWSEIVIHYYKKDTGDLAEIFSWSASGKFVVMERLAPIESEDDMKGYVYPDYLTDRKRENYGRDSDGKIKALDYASLKFLEGTFPSFT
jgi:hypothetical protein